MARKRKSPQRRKTKVVEIALTAEQRAKLRADTSGRIDASRLKLRPKTDIIRLVETLTGLRVRGRVSTAVAPPPKGSIWVSAQ